MPTPAAPVAPLSVLVPDEIGLRLLADRPGLQAIPYELGQPLDEAQRNARVLVVRYPAVEPTLELMAQLPRLEFVQALSAGYEHWVGRLPPGVLLANVRGAHGGAVAEWVLAVLLSHFRQLPDFAAAQREGRWRPHPTETLHGKCVVILGAGDIAHRTHEMLMPFGCDVRLVGRTARDGVITMDDFLRDAAATDVLVVALPVTRETTGIIDGALLARLTSGAVVVNAGRGALLDTDALIAAAGSGRIYGILDVVDPEPLPDAHPLWSTPGIVVTPHVAGAIPGVWERAWAAALFNLDALAAGTAPEELAVDA